MPSSSYPADLRTLVVDDDPTMLEIIVTVLRGFGLTRVEAADDGSAALDRLTTSPIELLVCDLNMPGMDGVRLLGHIAASAAPPAIILLSGEDPRVLDATRQFAEAKQLVVLGVLSKPVTSDSLLALLQRYRPNRERRPYRSRIPLDDDKLGHDLETEFWHLVYQPKVDLRSGALVGVEGLLRWQDPVFGPIPPPDVIRAAENAKWIDALTLAVLSRAVRDRASMARNGIDTNIAINVSMHNLHSEVIVDQMVDIVAAAGDRPERFTLEITETHLVKDLAQVLGVLIRARLRGFRIAIDDYGTGAAAMQLLSQLPSTELKIDRSFVVAGPRSEQGRAFLQSAIELGLRLGQTVIAEGIDSEEEARLALELGCHIGQGYFYGKPMMLEALIAWASTRPTRPAAPMTMGKDSS